MYSNISPPAIHDEALFSLIVQRTVHGFVYAPGSSIVASYTKVRRFGREMRSVRCSPSVCGNDPASHCFSLNPIESMMNVSPSHLPMEWPKNVGRRFSRGG